MRRSLDKAKADVESALARTRSFGRSIDAYGLAARRYDKVNKKAKRLDDENVLTVKQTGHNQVT